MKSTDKTLPLGSALEHGVAHAKDHLVQNRRSFLRTLGLAGVGSSLMLGGTAVKAFGGSSVLRNLMEIETDRVLVLIQLKGGVDGLNLVVPIQEQAYYDARPNLGISAAESINLDSAFGLNPALADFEGMWGEGEMAIFHGIGYPDPNLSHFEAIKVYQTTDPARIDRTGWIGRTLGVEYPDYFESTPTSPLAVEISPNSSRLFEGIDGQMGMAIRDPEEFYRLAATGQIYDTANLPANAYGDELSFLRGLANSASAFAGSIENSASLASDNSASYPDTGLSEGLSIVSRLIRGGLGAKIYTVKLQGFDTHSNQGPRLAALLQDLSGSIKAFYQDLKSESLDSKVMTLSYSEFGRRLQENGSFGTDHGTVSPLMMFGGSGALNGGFYGALPNLQDLDSRGNLYHTSDFRSVYGSILGQWFGIDCLTSNDILNYTGDGFNIVSNPTPGGSASCALPVELSDIGVLDLGDGNLELTWETATEFNNQGFEIEMLPVDQFKAEWKKVGWIDGQGSSTEQSLYAFQIRVENRGLYRFRLKQFDFAGGFSYSNRVDINVDYPAAYYISEVYPNPVINNARLRISSQKDERMRVEMYDQNGRLADTLFDQDVRAEQNYTVEIDAGTLASGMYILNIRGGELFSEVKKMIVSR